MIRRRLGMGAVALYPADIRDARAEEILGTLLDAGSGSLIAFLREAASIAVGGLLARSRVAYTRSIRSSGPEMLAAAAIMWLANDLAFTVQTFVQDPGYPHQLTFGGWARALIPAWALLLVLKRSDRLAGALGLAWVGLNLIHNNPKPTQYLLEIPPTAVFAAMMIVANKTHGGWRPLVWLLPSLLWGFSVVTGRGLTDGIGFVAPPLVALGFVALDPAFAVGTGLAWTLLGISEIAVSPVPLWPWPNFAWASCAPLALLLAAACQRLVRRASRP